MASKLTRIMRQKSPKGFATLHFARFQCLSLVLWPETEPKPFTTSQIGPLSLSEPHFLRISAIPILSGFCNLFLKVCPLNAVNRIQSGNGGATQKPMQYAHANTVRNR